MFSSLFVIENSFLWMYQYSLSFWLSDYGRNAAILMEAFLFSFWVFSYSDHTVHSATTDIHSISSRRRVRGAGLQKYPLFSRFYLHPSVNILVSCFSEVTLNSSFIIPNKVTFENLQRLSGAQPALNSSYSIYSYTKWLGVFNNARKLKV
jgi:hypothetical protein